ncbi:hypothetical protein [Corynebacterium sp.]|uniref:hypothetical protein n=1 Tax=Corynebacterium sp. TaxID=1720 RepID=UPI0026DCA6EC|nr:hypothetical protein [Corynebacterium sp.]MDO5076541.1 hypothetical protein [Corynebacterium sp.]
MENSRLAVYRALGLVVGLILILTAGAYLFSGNTNAPNFDVGAPCAQWGLDPEDPRAKPGNISPEEHRAFTSKNDNVDLNQTFEFEGIEGRYHLFARNIDYSKPVGFIVRLHGDGGFEFSYPNNLPNCLAAVAESYNMVILAPESPITSESNNELTWWQDIPTKRKWVLALVREKIEQTNNVDRNNIWWMGYSGGAEFISYGLLNHRTDLVTGGTIMVGGGGAPKEQQLRDLDDTKRKEVPHYWVVGTEDDGTDPKTPFNARRAATEGEEFYRQHGFTATSRTELQHINHLNLPQAAILDRSLDGTLPHDTRPYASNDGPQRPRPAPKVDDNQQGEEPEADGELSIQGGNNEHRRNRLRPHHHDE